MKVSTSLKSKVQERLNNDSVSLTINKIEGNYWALDLSPVPLHPYYTKIIQGQMR